MDRRYVGIDLHRRRSVIYAMDAEGEKLFCERIANDSLWLLEVVSRAGKGAEVVIEATYGWYRAVDLLQETAARLVDTSCARRGRVERMSAWRGSSRLSSSVMWSQSLVGVI